MAEPETQHKTMSRYALSLVVLEAVEQATGLDCDLMQFPPGASLLFGGGKGTEPVIAITIEITPGQTVPSLLSQKDQMSLARSGWDAPTTLSPEEVKELLQ